jgi:hypothetical protein
MRAGTRGGARWLAGGWAVAVGLAATLMAGPAQAAPSPFTYDAVAWTGNSAIVAGTDSAGNLYFFSEPAGGRTFSTQLVAADQHIVGAPAIAWTGTTAIIAVSQGSDVDYWFQLPDSSAWRQEQVAAAGGTSYGPAAIAWTGTSVIIAASDTHNGLDYLDYWSESTSTWQEQQVATGVWYNYVFGPSIGWTGSRVIIAFVDRLTNLDYWYQDAGSRTWHKQRVAVGGFLGFYGPSIAWTGGAVDITDDNGHGDLYYWYEPAGTATWHYQFLAQDIYAPPAIAWTGRSRVIAVTSEHGNLEIWRQAADTKIWHNVQVAAAPGVKGFANASVAGAGGAVFITAVDRNGGKLDYWSQLYGTTGWYEQLVALPSEQPRPPR